MSRDKFKRPSLADKHAAQASKPVSEEAPAVNTSTEEAAPAAPKGKKGRKVIKKSK